MLKCLRVKEITQLSIVLMARPSDLAPKGKGFNADDMVTESITFNTDQVQFHDDGSMTVDLYGIKNDMSRSGFEVKIPSATEAKVDTIAKDLQAAIDYCTLHGKGFTAKSFRPCATASIKSGVQTFNCNADRSLENPGDFCKSLCLSQCP